MKSFVTIIEEMHDLRDQADRLELPATRERLRVAIIEAARELDTPTGLSVQDLIKGGEYNPPDPKV